MKSGYPLMIFFDEFSLLGFWIKANKKGYLFFFITMYEVHMIYFNSENLRKELDIRSLNSTASKDIQ